MPRTFPWHASSSGVYHNNSDCALGRRIGDDAAVQGTGGKRLCERCARLNRLQRLRLEGKEG